MGDTAAQPEVRAQPAGDSEVAVIGAGQAGVAMGYFLRQRAIPFVILERADSIGSAWRERWDSLTLFTPRRYSSLPGLPFPGDPDDYPTRDEVIDYLERYAETFDLPIELSSEVRELRRRYGVEIKPRTVAADGRTIRFQDGSEVEVEAVIWSTGYRPDYSWIKLPIFDSDGRLATAAA
jgi:cation diffusion facilitator CzcD-associated flavoprotein CzcO